jgi:hypothetical protein
VKQRLEVAVLTNVYPALGILVLYNYSLQFVFGPLQWYGIIQALVPLIILHNVRLYYWFNWVSMTFV